MILSLQGVVLHLGASINIWPWAPIVGLCAALVIAYKGLQKRYSAVAAVLTAIEIGAIKPEGIERLERVASD